MPERAPERMSIAEFLAWDDGTDTRYELVDGRPLAMAPPIPDHGAIILNLGILITRAIAHRPGCRAVTGTGLRLSDRPRANAWIPDLMMSCEPQDDRPLLEAPRLVVEVLSPGTERFDHNAKLAGYTAVPSIEEVWLVGSTRRYVIVYARLATGWHAGAPFIGRALFASPALGCDVTLDEVYARTSLAEGDPELPG
jgi:Uma2 family endonuclease